ncbi:non-ribosomal peptide synthetase [Cohnella cholangitidis]|uniref:Amino acid adenylation domain-containing protein n=1 Tax=Cohnella cholangitidis TaxID=2598458 RepID=A0A7G5C4N6_9BACL|nr:non-ribosomal peptide synthetase [Cohnella cholangitidis]QMV44170.1 amino acid adenylation domain-containing protein [Cohnella cholangitidis]
MLDFNLIEFNDTDADQLEEIEELSSQEIAVIGISAKLPLVDNLDQFWKFVRSGVDFISEFPKSRRQDTDIYARGRTREGEQPAYFDGAYLEDIDCFDHAFFRLSPKEASLMSPNQRLFLETAWKAIEDAGYSKLQMAGSQTGVYVGFNTDTLYDYKRMIAETDPDSLSLAVPGNLTSVIAGRLSYLLDLKGPSMCVDTACSSSLVAVHLACQAIRNQECEMAIAGSVKMNLLPLENEVKIGIEASDWRAHTFDDSSDGTGAGEGVIAFVLKPLHRALQDGDFIHGVIKGSAVNQDGSSVGMTAPNVKSQEEVIVRAWQNAGIDPETISYIEAHGTGTKLGDPIEIDGLHRAFRRFTDRRQFVAIGSVKANFGHLDHAAGMAGMLKAIMAMRNREIPPLPHFAKPNRAIDFIQSPLYVNDRLTEWETNSYPRRCGVSAFGMSGTNCHVVLEEAPKKEDKMDSGEGMQEEHLLTLSAKSEAALGRLVQQYARLSLEQISLADLCYTANTGRGHYEYRLAVVFHNAGELSEQLARLIDGGLTDNRSQGIYYGNPKSISEGIAGTGAWNAQRHVTDVRTDPRRDIARSYTEGADVEWSKLYAGQRRYRIPLPTYPFEKSRCWLDAPNPARFGTEYDARIERNSSPDREIVITGKPNGSYSDIETVIAQAWGHTLGLRQVDLADNYYELGGDSIMAMKIVNRISLQLSVRLEVADLLKHATIGDLASFIERLPIDDPQSASGIAALTKIDAREQYPLTSSQYRVFIQEQFAAAGTGNNTPFGIKVTGELDASRLESCFRQLIQRHESLRSSFAFVNGEAVTRVDLDPEFQVQHFRSSEERLDQVVREFIRPFDLEKSPLLRVGLVEISTRQHLILIDLHHIVSDGVSTSILIKEFCELYKGAALPELPLQYTDYSVWQREMLESDGYRQQKQFWLIQLSGELPLLNMPVDYARGDRKAFNGNTLHASISAELKSKLERLAQQRNMTLNSLLFSVYAWMLSQRSGQNDLVVGTLVAGRNQPHLDKIIGMFINFLPIRVGVQPELSFADFASEVHRSIVEAYAHDYPFDQMINDLQVKTERSRNPLYDTMFVYHNEFSMNPTDRLNMDEVGLLFEQYPLLNPASPLDFKLDVWNGLSESLTLVLQYDTSLFKESTMQQGLNHFVKLAELVAENPDQLLSSIVLFDASEAASKADSRLKEPLPVAVSATFTAEPIAASVEWWCRQFHQEVGIEFAAYHQVFQQLLDPNSLISVNDGINLLLIRFEDWIRDDDSVAMDGITSKLERIYSDLMTALRNRSKLGTYLIGTFPVSARLTHSGEISAYLESLNERWMNDLAGLGNVHVIDLGQSLAALYQVPEIFDPVKDQEGHMPFTDEFYGAMGTAVARTIVSRNAHPFKVVVLDCDNTLWRGVCGEDGPLGISIDEPFLALQRFMLDRYNEGMLLAICSKNNEPDVWEVFDRNPNMLLKKEHFVGAKINWSAKADNIRTLSEELNLGLDSFIFVDDNAKECGEMIARCPEVLTLQIPKLAWQIPYYLKHVWAFDKFVVTEEDRQRSAYYAAESQRRSMQDHAAASIDEFLGSLDLKLKMRLLTEEQIGRAAQLTQRTNQFNLSTIRRTDEDVRRLISDPNMMCWGIEVADRFGDYGFVGLVFGFAERNALVLDTFLLSCRVLGRRVEQAILSELKRVAVAAEAHCIEAPFVATAKNDPFKLFLEQTGWEHSENQPDEERYVLPLERIPDEVAWITAWEDNPELNLPERQVAAGYSRASNLASQPEARQEQPMLWDVLGYEDVELTHRNQLLPLQFHRAEQLMKLTIRTREEQQRMGKEYDEPSNETEMELTSIWEEILGMEPIGVQDHFFDIGGNSLQAVSLASRIHQRFQVEISLRDLFAIPTIRQLASLINRKEQSEHSSIEPAIEQVAYPVTSAQKRLLVLQQLDVPNLAYNQPVLFTVDGDLDVGRFRYACEQLVRRHRILTTAFRWEQGEFVGWLDECTDFAVDYDELAGKSLTEAIAEFIRPFDLTKAPLFRAGLIRTDERKHVLLFDMHHIVADGVSISLLMKDFFDLYQGTLLPAPRIQYRDYAFWQGGFYSEPSMRQHESYWLKVFPDEIPVLNLPVDSPRPVVRSYAGRRFGFELASDLREAVKKLAFGMGATPYMVYLAAFNILLAKTSGQDDIVVGSPVAGRPHADLQTMVGMFVQTLALRNKPVGTRTFRQFVAEVKDNALEAFEHQDYPFESLVEKLNVPRDLSRNPLFDTMFVYQNMDWTNQQAAGLRFQPYLYDTEQSRFDLTLELAEIGDGMRVHFEFATDLFLPKTIERLSRHFIQILKEVTTAPDIPLSRIDMLEKAEKSQILFGFNATYSDYAGDKTVHRLFEERVRQTPDQAALVCEDKHLTYRELNEKANRLARALRDEGVQPDQLVGMLVERSFEMLIGILAILKAGGAYVPIDPEYPPERMSYILEDSGAKLLLLQGRLKGRLPEEGFCGKLIELDDPRTYDRDGATVEAVAAPSHLAYVIYTSGSTGKPKGVMIEHRSAVHILSQLERKYPMLPGDRYLLKTTYAFDVSVAELFGWFAGNGTLVILPPGHEKDPTLLLHAIERQRITHVNFVPSMFHALLNSFSESQLAGARNLKYVFVAGEALSKKLVDQYHSLQLPAKLENIYGPTEVTIYATQYPTVLGATALSNVPIGKPLGNVQAWIVNGDFQLQPIGVPGELCVSGEGLARGYLNRPDLTEQKFVDNPFVPGDRMYRTGDFVRWLPDGNIEYLGRIDHQVKIRGYRIELGEVESQLRQTALVEEAVVVALTDGTGQKVLCAYFVAGEPLSAAELRGALAKELPGYMIPSRFMQLESMPLNANGKINLKALPEPVFELDQTYEAPSNSLESELAQIWSDVLGIETIGVQERFFEIGGHSLNAIAMRTRIQQSFQIELSLTDIFQSPTIKQLAQAIEQASPAVYAGIPLAEQRRDYPLSSGQLNLFVLHQLEGGATAYNLPGLFRVEGAIDRHRAEEAFRKLIRRQESLRTSFAVDNGRFVQIIHSEAEFEIEYREEYEDTFESVCRSLIAPFDLSRPPLVRVALIKLIDRRLIAREASATEEDQRHVLFFDMHHIVSDGVSLAVMMRDFVQLYDGRELPELRIQYKDYAVWQQQQMESDAYARHAAYWHNAFGGPLPELRLPTDFPRPAVQSFQGNRVHLSLDEDLTEKLKAIAADNGATLNMVLFAAYSILLSKISGQEDLVIGIPSAGRTDHDLQPLIGMFVQMLALRCKPTNGLTFDRLLQDVKQLTLSAFEHQHYPLEELIKGLNLPRDISRNPLFDVSFVMQNYEKTEFKADRLSASPLAFVPDSAKFDLTLEAVESDGRLDLSLEYAVKLFRMKTAERWLDDFARVLQVVVSDSKIELRNVTLDSGSFRNQPLMLEDVDFNF